MNTISDQNGRIFLAEWAQEPAYNPDVAKTKQKLQRILSATPTNPLKHTSTPQTPPQARHRPLQRHVSHLQRHKPSFYRDQPPIFEYRPPP